MLLLSVRRWSWVVLLVGTGSLRPVMAQTSLESTLDLSEKFRPGVSLMWSPCGQAAWDELRAFHHVDKIEMTPRSHTAEILNAFQWNRDKTLPNGTVIFGGDDSEDFRKRIRDELRRRCGESAVKMIGPYLPPASAVQGKDMLWQIKSALCVSAISRVLRFSKLFIPAKDPRIFTDLAGRTHPAYGFGAEGLASGSYRDQVHVLSDDLKGTFALRFSLEAAEDRDAECMVLLRDASVTSLEDGLLKIRRLLAEKRQRERQVKVGEQTLIYTDELEANDTLWVPELHAAVSCDFLDLEGKRYLEDKTAETWWQIRDAQQLLNFRLNHEGAVIRAVMKVEVDPFGAPAPPPHAYRKAFIFDKSFLASFWREGAEYPYLACWVDGPEMLVGKK